MSESADLLQLRPSCRQLSSTLTIDQMCRHRTALPSASNPESSNPEQNTMDPHFILDIFTLCSVASLICILTKALKKRRLIVSHQTKAPKLQIQYSTGEVVGRHLPQDAVAPAHQDRALHSGVGRPQPRADYLAWRLAKVSRSLKSIQMSFSPSYRHNLFTFVIFISCGEGLALSKSNISLKKKVPTSTAFY